MKLTTFVLAVSFATLTAPAFGQGDGGDSAEKARVHVGPLSLNPSVALTNLGLDNNVFNQTPADHPQSDFTMTVTPKTDWSLRLGQSSVSGTVTEDIVYYQRFVSERSANTTNRVTIRVPMNRLTLTLGDAYVNTRDRPGFEIDARSQHTQTDYTASAEVRAFGRTFVALNGGRSIVAFDRDALFLGSHLQRELNRHMTTAGVSARYGFTPVTALTMAVQREEDRFTFSPVRDSNSLAMSAGVAFKPRSLLSGSVSVGYRRFEPLAADVPRYQGLTAHVDVAARIVAGTRLGLQLQRDVQYSYDLSQPYYLLSGGAVSLAHSLFGPLDVAGRLGLNSLAYRGRIGSQTELPDRTDSVHTLGGTIGYRLGGGMRLSLNVDQQQRISDDAQHRYSAVRYGTAVTYGF